MAFREKPVVKKNTEWTIDHLLKNFNRLINQKPTNTLELLHFPLRATTKENLPDIWCAWKGREKKHINARSLSIAMGKKKLKEEESKKPKEEEEKAQRAIFIPTVDINKKDYTRRVCSPKRRRVPF
ncbi:hypothetical protein AVEN_232465-1 [Araneus ventricosus]|uniref:Uncharacterized protein n=1 Tax=Araneus ventricosus TaxID=182803 RepID=A0A4Y2EAJ9_ARAVE|nr:hypothetical protein AVEN_232465-1 [Araneus ventricosus]